MVESPEFESTSIVLLGHFNPLIFRPDWFAKNGLVGQQEADDAAIEIIHHDVVIFSLGWGKFDIQSGRFSATTLETIDPRIYDLVVKAFKEFLPHTPIGRMGINLTVDFPVKDVDALVKIGEQLAPKKPWGEWEDALRREEEGKRSGMRTLTMQQTIRDDGWIGHIQAKVEPSNRFTPDFGVQVSINDHVEVEDWKDVTGCEEILAKLESDWKLSIDGARMIVKQVMALA